jgi:AraC-like DNA-binding protein
MKRKIGKSLAKRTISFKRIIIIFALVILTSFYYAQEEGEILLHSEKKEQKNSKRDGSPIQITARQLLQNIKKRNYTGGLIEFNFKRAPVKRILSLFSKISGLKIEAEPNIIGEMSCKGKKIPWDEALDFFLRENRLYMTLESDTFLRIHKFEPNGMDNAKEAYRPSIFSKTIFLNFLSLLLLALLGAALYRISKKKFRGKRKSKKISLDPIKADEYLKGLVFLFEVKKIYRDEDISLQLVAEKLSIPAYQLSLVINEKMNKTFFDLVNDYRIEEVKKHLSDPNQSRKKVLDIALDVGFNTKTAFNRTFKKYTQMTPTQFRDTHLKTTTNND